MKKRLNDVGEHWFAFSVVLTIAFTCMLFELADNLG